MRIKLWNQFPFEGFITGQDTRLPFPKNRSFLDHKFDLVAWLFVHLLSSISLAAGNEILR